MALSQDQSELLQTAVENLNQSVAVNKEVLEIVKSVGNTGAVDIAAHDNNKNAHSSGVNDVLGLNHVYVKSKTFSTTPETKGNAWAIRIGNNSNSGQTKDDYGNAAISLYSRLEKNVNRYYPAVHFDNAVDSAFGESDAIRYLGRMYARVADSEGGGYSIIGSIHFMFGSLKHDYCLSLGTYSRKKSAYTNIILWSDSLLPDTAIDLGNSAFQFKDLYLQNSPIVSSDRRLKQDFAEVPEAVFKAWANVNFQVYKFKEAVAKKGEAAARKHVGLVAQDIIEAFEAQGLSAFDYGIVCHDEWDDQYYDEQIIDAEAVLDAEGKVLVPEKSHMEHRLLKTAGDVYTVRYEEALALEAAYQRWRLKKIEEALAAKGITL